MGEAAGEGAADADRQMRDVVRDRRQEPRERAGGRPARSKTTWRVRAPMASAPSTCARPTSAVDAVDVDEHRRPRQAEVHRRHQALAAGKHAAVAAVAREELEGFLERSRRVVVEGRGLHLEVTLAPSGVGPTTQSAESRVRIRQLRQTWEPPDATTRLSHHRPRARDPRGWRCGAVSGGFEFDHWFSSNSRRADAYQAVPQWHTGTAYWHAIPAAEATA